MSVTYELRGGLLLLNLDGDYEPEDVPMTFRAAMDDPRCPPRVALVVDVRRSGSLEKRNPDEIRTTAELLGPYAERIGGRCAIVAESPLHYGLGRIGSAHTEKLGVETMVFRDYESAIEWLGTAERRS